MSKSETRPVLAGLDPQRIGYGIGEIVLKHIRWLAALAGVPPETRYRPEAIAFDGARLCEYAQRGPSTDPEWTHNDAIGALETVCTALYSRAVDRKIESHASLALDALPEGALEDPIAVVLIAAHGRYKIHAGDSVSAAELAALAGLSPRMVRHLASKGEIEATGERVWRVRPKDARRWLAARGIEGLE